MIPRPGFATTFHTVLSASCSSTMTPVAPTMSVTTPTIVATMPPLRWLDVWIIVWMASAAEVPSRPPSCSTMWPSAALVPSTRPATAIVRSSTGASAKIV